MSLMPTNQGPSILHRLNEDVLIQIFKLLRPNRGLRSLSATCKSLRRAIVPILFKNCTMNVSVPIVLDRFLPPALWAYCELFSLADRCPDINRMRQEHLPLYYTDDRGMCGVMDGQVLKTALHAMPRLRSICVYFRCNEIHGLSWQTLTSILTTPSLENFNLQLFNFSPRPRFATDVGTLSLAPLKSFRYFQLAFRHRQHYFPPERDALADILGELHNTLEVLHLPSMSAPLNTLSGKTWYRLRELVLHGQLPEGPRTPFITLLSRMPKLRLLHLKLALPVDVEPQAVWPPDLDTSFPWPELEELVVSFPTPEDRLYASLPSCLRHLSLRCCPHYCVHKWVDRPMWHSPLLSASEMLRVLSQCRTLPLDHLQLEYRADNSDMTLLRSLSVAFPHLSALEIHRIRPAGVDAVPMVAIGEQLRSFDRLHTLSIHLDSPDHPTPGLIDVRRGFDVGLTYEQMVTSREMLQSHADLLAPLLGSSVRLLRLIQRTDQGGKWWTFRIYRGKDTGNVVGVEKDPADLPEILSPDWFVEIPGLD